MKSLTQQENLPMAGDSFIHLSYLTLRIDAIGT
ncbi:hypothetical protein BFJ72_g5602 [Fusarium proliferatum]|uniref:Uncharacterized protein n=1 Tax=Gibberella intermedia TaxID=948311 RepID=A0A420TJI6_GIBIN|nr:hypothetical protein BFJ72_g5602 [Fusarium proliferatum]